MRPRAPLGFWGRLIFEWDIHLIVAKSYWMRMISLNYVEQTEWDIGTSWAYSEGIWLPRYMITAEWPNGQNFEKKDVGYWKAVAWLRNWVHSSWVRELEINS